MSKKKIQLKISKDDTGVAYIYLPTHPGPGTTGVVHEQIEVSDFVDNYQGPSVYLDFDKVGRLIGIEIVS